MKLADLRKYSIRKQAPIHFTLRNGMECVITARGIAEVAALKGPPGFNLEEELALADEFLIEPPPPLDKKAERKNPAKPRSMTRDELTQLVTASATNVLANHAPEHEDD